MVIGGLIVEIWMHFGRTIDTYSIDLFVQVLSGNFLRSYRNDIINIHHGLLPSFKGGNPSKQVGLPALSQVKLLPLTTIRYALCGSFLHVCTCLMLYIILAGL